MSSLWRLARPAAVLAVLAVLTTTSFAQNKDGSAEIGLSYSYIRFDEQSEIDDRIVPTAMVGYNFTKRHGGEIVFSSSTATPERGPSFPVDVDILRVGYTFNAYPKQRAVSFFRIGTGVYVVNPAEHPQASSRLDHSETKWMLYTGGGIKFFFNESLALRFSLTADLADAGAGAAHPDVHAAGDIGLVVVIGGREPEEKPAEEPVP